MRIGQRLEEERVDDAENCRCRPDSDRQRQDDNEREPGRPSKCAKGVSDIEVEIEDPVGEPGTHSLRLLLSLGAPSNVLPVAREVAEAPQRLGPRCRLIHSLRTELFGPEVEVQTHLLVSIVHQAFARFREPKQPVNAVGKSSLSFSHGISRARGAQRQWRHSVSSCRPGRADAGGPWP